MKSKVLFLGFLIMANLASAKLIDILTVSSGIHYSQYIIEGEIINISENEIQLKILDKIKLKDKVKDTINLKIDLRKDLFGNIYKRYKKWEIGQQGIFFLSRTYDDSGLEFLNYYFDSEIPIIEDKVYVKDTMSIGCGSINEIGKDCFESCISPRTQIWCGKFDVGEFKNVIKELIPISDYLVEESIKFRFSPKNKLTYREKVIIDDVQVELIQLLKERSKSMKYILNSYFKESFSGEELYLEYAIKKN